MKKSQRTVRNKISAREEVGDMIRRIIYFARSRVKIDRIVFHHDVQPAMRDQVGAIMTVFRLK